MQRVRLRYAKRGRLRFTSHRDFSRAFERAIFRARVPMAYSSGFNPHPRISYAGAAPTGSASEAEYVELALAEVVDPAGLVPLLDEALPDGLDIIEAVEATPGSLNDRLQASRWRIETASAEEALTTATGAFLDREEVVVERMTKRGLRSFDVRAAVLRLTVDGEALDLVLRHETPAVRPDDVVRAITAVAGIDLGEAPRLIRLAQGPLGDDGDTVGDPLAP